MIHRYSDSCIQCGACTSQCPVDNEIPYLLEAYDNYQDEGIRALQEAVADGMDQSIVCLLCDACTEACPQEIPISEIMGELMDAMGELD